MIHFRSIAVTFRAFTLVALLGLCATVGNAQINYGDFGPVPPGVRFNDVTESSGTDPVPLYGPPMVFSVGLDFDPMGFVASANGGGMDITDGQLNFTLESTNPDFVAFESINLFEAGDYSLVGTGTAATQVFAGAIIHITVTEIDGAAITPFNLAPTNASVGFNLAANQGVTQPWSLGLSSGSISAQLAAAGFSFDLGATELEVVIDNQLIALSEEESLAFIAKKDFRLDVGVIPEPATTALLGIGGLMATVAWFRRRRARA
jgi:hypothetical protein